MEVYARATRDNSLISWVVNEPPRVNVYFENKALRYWVQGGRVVNLFYWPFLEDLKFHFSHPGEQRFEIPHDLIAHLVHIYQIERSRARENALRDGDALRNLIRSASESLRIMHTTHDPVRYDNSAESALESSVGMMNLALDGITKFKIQTMGSMFYVVELHELIKGDLVIPPPLPKPVF